MEVEAAVARRRAVEQRPCVFFSPGHLVPLRLRGGEYKGFQANRLTGWAGARLMSRPPDPLVSGIGAELKCATLCLLLHAHRDHAETAPAYTYQLTLAGSC
ncbi:hypothetical protein NDU88_002816 [Pleurodeles waltl]|uniref:Uncharacterized protein n=1 Tax=Pleurodeles waltl TaxID=8319 RepID=A0AAV7RGN3_PLEWA|nr:hypothetical protein NDU88_002816 [Pleurodeles waltl]